MANYEPTEDEIREAAAQIRAGWGRVTTRKREQCGPVPYQLLTGGLAENNYRHCPNCGAKIALVALESNHVLQND